MASLESLKYRKLFHQLTIPSWRIHLLFVNFRGMPLLQLKLAWPGEPFAEFASWRLICLPGFLAPLAVFLHVASLRQNLGGGDLMATVRQKDV